MQIYKEEIVEIDGVKMRKVIVDHTTVVFKRLSVAESEPVPPEEKQKPEDSLEWKFSCRRCNFFTNDENLYKEHVRSKEHKKITGK